MIHPLELRARALRDRVSAMKREAMAVSEAAAAIKEETLNARLRLWQDRLGPTRKLITRDRALERALDAALSVTSAACANIQWLHPDRRLELIAHRGLSPSFVRFFQFVEGDGTACCVALRERRTVMVPDVASSPIFAGTQALTVLLDAGIRSVKSTPLVNRTGTTLGVMSVHYHEPRPYLDCELVRFQSLAYSVSDLIERSAIV